VQGYLPDVEGRGMASEGVAGTGRRAGRRVERASRRWRRRTARRRPGGGTASAAEQSRGAEGAQRKKMRGENVRGLRCKNKKI
jgi:hypothetical protein